MVEKERLYQLKEIYKQILKYEHIIEYIKPYETKNGTKYYEIGIQFLIYDWANIFRFDDYPDISKETRVFILRPKLKPWEIDDV